MRGPAFERSSGKGASYAATTSSGGGCLQAPTISGLIGTSGVRSTKAANWCQPSLICWWPVNTPVSMATRRAIRSGCSSVATRSPIGPPQSWTTRVTS